MEIFFTDAKALALPIQEGVDLDTNRAEAFARHFVPDGMPFVLNPDGSYHSVLNRFFRSLPVSGVRSKRSWRAYAYDLVTWARFLDERRNGRGLLEADRRDLIAFHAARRLSEPPYRISAEAWNRLIAAMEKFYQWTLAVELLPRPPFQFEQQHPSGSVAVVGAKEKVVRHRGDVRFLSLSRYTTFRDVGLRGLAPGGAEDQGFANRCGARNAAFADLCVSTGLRLEECNSLLACELPPIDTSDGARSSRFELAPPVTKGDRGRVIRIPHRVLRLVHDYADTERALALQRAAARGWTPTYRHLYVRSPDVRGGQLRVGDDRWVTVRWADLPPDDRARLLEVDAAGQVVGPLALWASERGTAMTARSWESVFSRASQRCDTLGLDVLATPHTLRHTFAVHLLTQLVRQQITLTREGAPDLRLGAYQRVMGDPLRHLQKLLGHARVSSTYIYLDSVGEAQELIDDAVARLADRVSLPGPEDMVADEIEEMV